MSFFEDLKNKIKNNNSKNKRRIDSDTLERLARTREAVYYYQSIKHVADRRRFTNSLYGILEDFFKLCEDPIARKQIDESIKVLASIRTGSVNNMEVFEKIKAEESEGYRLLEISPPENLASIKNKYYSASKKYHPDHGGTTENQQAINNVYALLQNYLTKGISEDQIVEQDSEDSLEKFLINLFQIYLDVAEDDYDCDRCISLAKNQLKFGLWSSGEGRLKDYDSIIEEIEFLKKEIKDNPESSKAQFCVLLIILTCRRGVIYGFERCRIRDLRSELAEWELKQKRKRKPDKINFVFRSASQVENAFRLGLISNDRYEKLSSKYNERIKAEKTAFSQVKAYADNPGFILDLGIYPIELANRPSKEYVQEPMYFCERFNHLDEDQQTEYLSMLKPPVMLQIVKKYLYQRFVAYSIGIVKNYDGLDLNRVIREVKLLSALGNVPAESVIKLVEYLRGLPFGERKKRLAYLVAFDSDESPLSVLSITLSFSFGGNSDNEKSEEYKFPITPTEKYFSFASLPLERLELFKRTGDFRTDKESKSADEAMVGFNKELDSLHKSSIGQKYFECITKPKNITEEEKLSVYKEYLENILVISEKYPVDVARYLDFDYLYNRITTAQAKIKDWSGIIEFGEKYFSLPEELRTRGGTERDSENIKKRMEKARQEIKE